MIQRIRTWFFLRRHLRACQKLQALVDRQASSYETRRYREKRAAALKHTRGVA
jgi:hypothetical protein